MFNKFDDKISISLKKREKIKKIHVTINIENLIEMKKKLFFLLLSANLVSAQTIITKAFNDPIIGDTYNGILINGIDASVTGNPVTFSFPTVTTGSGSATSTYSAPTINEIALYPGTTIKHNNGNSTIMFYKQSPNKIEVTGMSMAAANYWAKLNFSADNATTMSYPMSYGFNGTDTAKGTFAADVGNGEVAGYIKGNISTKAEGYGTLILGTKIITNVLKIKISQNFNIYLDSNYLFSVGTMTNTTYSYYDALHKFPLLTYTEGNISVPVMSINQSESGAIGLEEIFLGTETSNLKSNFIFYPNPTKDIVMFDSSKKYHTANIYNAEGRLIQHLILKTNTIDTSKLKAGIYIIILTEENGESQKIKIIKE